MNAVTSTLLCILIERFDEYSGPKGGFFE